MPGKDTESLSDSLYWFPVVGLILGSMLYGVSVLPELAGTEIWPEGMAVVLLFLAVMLTRGLHLDGLCDWADGFWGARSREKVLNIMKDPCVGVFGAAVLVLILLAKWVCLVRLVDTDAMSWVIAATVISRTMQVVLAGGNPYARKDGGTGSAFITQAGRSHVTITLITSVIILLVISELDWRWLAVLLSAWLMTSLFGLYCRKRVHGVTGDLLGACSELIETSVLAAGAVWA